MRISINRIRLEFKAPCADNIPNGFSVLIESDWNLKTDAPPPPAKQSSINRIRLEFKAFGSGNGMLRDMCINRIRLEFKDF